MMMMMMMTMMMMMMIMMMKRRRTMMMSRRINDDDDDDNDDDGMMVIMMMMVMVMVRMMMMVMVMVMVVMMMVMTMMMMMVGWWWWWWSWWWWWWGDDGDDDMMMVVMMMMRRRSGGWGWGNASEDFTRATLYRNLQEKCRCPDWGQNADTHFVRACAVEMHVNISQETSEEPLYIENYRENAAAQIEPRTRTHILCEPAPSKCTSRFREPLYMEVAGETPQTKMSPERTQTQTFYCASVRSRNACQDLTKATLCSFFWKNAALQSEHPDQAPAFTATARTLQCGHTVWRKIMDGNPHVTHIFLRVCLEIGHSKIQLYNWYHGF